jgi:hypothetical protein
MRTLLWVALVLIAQTASAESDVPPRRKGPLLAWLKAGTYRASYVAEPAVHVSSSGVHGTNVRTWYDPILADDLRAGRTVFHKGAAMVKELYFGGTEEVIGWAVMTKVRRRSGRTGRGWLFYETLDGSNRGVSFGRGLPLCTGCHRSGVDYLRSGFRP